MRFVNIAPESGNRIPRLGVQKDGSVLSLPDREVDRVESDLVRLMAAGGSAMREAHDLIAERGIPCGAVTYLPPVPRPPKIICVGLNYRMHAEESGVAPPDYPAIFGRYPTSLTGHRQAIVRPRVSTALDFEGELVFFVGRGGRNIAASEALAHVAGYTLCNEASIRDYQFKSSQWTMGKNFDRTGAVGPCFVSADELPEGAKGLRIETRLNGQTVQSANTNDMIQDVARLVVLLSEGMTLEPGDMVITGTPSGVGMARTPPLWMKAGDRVEIEVEGIGVLENWIVDQD